jgi:hypothetical protein
MNAMPRGAYSSQDYGVKRPHGYQPYGIQQYTPQQMRIFEGEEQYLSPDSYLGRLAGGDESIFNEIEEPALRQFNELQGNIASRFSGMGMGGRKSSGFQNTTNTALQDFASQLQAQRMNLRNQAIRDLMGFSNQFLNQRPVEKGFQKKDRSGGWGEGVSTLFGGGPGLATGDTGGAIQGMSNTARIFAQLGI